MKPIRPFSAICRGYKLNLSQTNALRSLVDRRKGVLHPYWIQLLLLIPYEYAKHLYDELLANEWVIPDVIEIGNTLFETELTQEEINILAKVELGYYLQYNLSPR